MFDTCYSVHLKKINKLNDHCRCRCRRFIMSYHISLSTAALSVDVYLLNRLTDDDDDDDLVYSIVTASSERARRWMKT